MDDLRHRVGRDADRRFREAQNHGTLPLSFDERVRNYGLGGSYGDCALGACAFRFGDDVARVRRRTLHARLCLLSLEVASVRAYGLAPLRLGGYDLPLLLHPLACHVKRCRKYEEAVVDSWYRWTQDFVLLSYGRRKK